MSKKAELTKRILPFLNWFWVRLLLDKCARLSFIRPLDVFVSETDRWETAAEMSISHLGCSWSLLECSWQVSSSGWKSSWCVFLPPSLAVSLPRGEERKSKAKPCGGINGASLWVFFLWLCLYLCGGIIRKGHDFSVEITSWHSNYFRLSTSHTSQIDTDQWIRSMLLRTACSKWKDISPIRKAHGV